MYKIPNSRKINNAIVILFFSPVRLSLSAKMILWLNKKLTFYLHVCVIYKHKKNFIEASKSFSI